MCRIFCGIFVDFSKKLIIIVIRMDMQKTRQAAISEAASRMQGHKVVAGAKQLRKALTSGKACGVFLAQDADPAITEPIAALCEENSVEYDWVPSMTELGRICGIEVGAAAAAYTD